MSDMHYLGEITMFGGTYAPRGWAFCDGGLLSIGQNPALFSLLGDRYGGDGRNTFALPNLKGRFPTHPEYPHILKGGASQIVLDIHNLPSHSHTLNASTSEGTTESPANMLLADANSRYPTNVYATVDPTKTVSMNRSSISTTGTSNPVNITPPFTGVYFIICLDGIYPPRS